MHQESELTPEALTFPSTSCLRLSSIPLTNERTILSSSLKKKEEKKNAEKKKRKKYSVILAEDIQRRIVCNFIVDVCSSPLSHSVPFVRRFRRFLFSLDLL